MSTISKASKITTFDPEGDLILVVGGESHEIRVSSKLICLASKPLKALLSNGLREASDAKARSSTNPYKLRLEDDVAQAMRIVCGIIHLDNTVVPNVDDVDEEWFYDFMLMVDKYDFSSVVSFCGEYWLHVLIDKWSARLTHPEADIVTMTEGENAKAHDPNLRYEFRTLVTSSYVLKNASLFWRATKLLCLCLTLSDLQDKALEDVFLDTATLPSNFWALLKTSVEANYRSLSAMINAKMQQLNTSSSTRYSDKLKTEHGRYLSQYVPRDEDYATGIHDALTAHEFNVQINAKSLWPFSSAMEKLSIVQHLQDLRGLDDLPGGLYDDTEWSLTTPSDNCKACHTSISAIGRQIADEVLEEIRGVCLGCLKGSSSEHEECPECAQKATEDLE